MRPFTDLRGPLRFPDQGVVRHFYKQGLDKRSGAVLELGCGNGVNLLPYAAAGWTCIGVDIDPEALADTRYNLEHRVHTRQHDLRDGLPLLESPQFDALILCHVLCYLTSEQAVRLMRDLKPWLAPGCKVFVRTRGYSDSRYGRGDEVEPDAYTLKISATGEEGHFAKFYSPLELAKLLDAGSINIEHMLSERWDNPQGGQVTHNDEWVVWGMVD